MKHRIISRTIQLAFTFFILSACYERDGHNVRIIENLPSPIELEGESLFEGVYGWREIHVVDSLLIARVNDPQRGLFVVYNTKTHQLQGEFGVRGRGPDEFMTPRFLGQKKSIGAATGLWILDRVAGGYRMILINLNLSLLSGHTTIDKVYHFPETLFPVYSFWHSRGYFLGNTEEHHELFIYSSFENLSKTSVISSFSDKLNLSYENSRRYYFNRLSFSEERGVLVSAMCHIPRVDFYSLAFHQTRLPDPEPLFSLVFDDIAHVNDDIVDGEEYYRYFEGIYSDDDGLLLLYLNSPANESFRKGFVEIISVDWNGIPLRTFRLRNEIEQFTYDPLSNSILGIDYNNDKLISYSLK